MTTTQVNVRAEPSSASAQLGMLAPFVKVQIMGRDSGGDWYQIQYEQGPAGRGWVTAQYINVQQGKDNIPIIGAPAGTGASPNASGTPAIGGRVIQQVNVRKGPGTEFDALGTLNAKDSVSLIGKDASGSWLQIQYAAAPEGKGWIAATYVQADSMNNLPIVGESGAVLGTGTAISTVPIITPTPAAARLDNDSAEAPAANVTFSPTGTRTLIYSSDVSAPQGDSQDWIEFTSYGAGMLISLSCNGNGRIKIELEEGKGTILQNWGGIACGETKSLNLHPGQAYLVLISIVPSNNSMEYVDYTLRIEDTG